MFNIFKEIYEKNKNLKNIFLYNELSLTLQELFKINLIKNIINIPEEYLIVLFLIIYD